LSDLAFWSVVAVIAAAELAIVATALRMRVRHDPSRGLVGTRPAEIVWTLLPTALLVAVVVYSYRLWRGG